MPTLPREHPPNSIPKPSDEPGAVQAATGTSCCSVISHRQEGQQKAVVVCGAKSRAPRPKPRLPGMAPTCLTERRGQVSALRKSRLAAPATC